MECQILIRLRYVVFCMGVEGGHFAILAALLSYCQVFLLNI